ncbi:hypothetical protein RhiirB3_431027 [Rhizophagus irregularis]|nr:hypothetical protein RhiirB3_431027 [Rhizophagus irregularis]
MSFLTNLTYFPFVLLNKMCGMVMENSISYKTYIFNNNNNNNHIKLTTLSSLPDDILYIIKKDLDFLSTISLRCACRQLYAIFTDSILFSEIILLSNINQQQFNNLINYIVSNNMNQYIRKVSFNQSQITEQAIVSVLEHFYNLQILNILACKQVKILPITNALVKWHQDKSGNSPDLKELKKIILTRCIGGKRHSLIIKKVIEDLRKLKCDDDEDITQNNSLYLGINHKPIPLKINLILNSSSRKDFDTNDDGIFQFQDCQNDTCEFCTMSCVICKTKYKYWDEFWIKCGWCKERNFCGKCVVEASKKNTFKNHAFQFMRIKLCQIFDLPCPY